jgi:hypothetical protein
VIGTEKVSGVLLQQQLEQARRRWAERTDQANPVTEESNSSNPRENGMALTDNNTNPTRRELIEEHHGSGVFIGVCGDQAAGKTVFLTAIHQTMTSLSANTDGSVTVDTTQYGGSHYFSDIEEQIRRLGRTVTGTLVGENIPAVLRKRLAQPLGSYRGGEYLPIYLLDFAGGHFTNIADMVTALDNQDTPDEVRTSLQEVQTYLDLCDGLIILVNSNNFNLEGHLASDETPFSRSVECLILKWFHARKPMALVFTQRDLNPGLTEAELQDFHIVQGFQHKFTDDLTEAKTGSKPYGFVKLMSCYELDSASNQPKKQNREGGIWTGHAQEVFTKIMDACWESARARIQAAYDETEKSRQSRRIQLINDEMERDRIEREKAEQRKRGAIVGIGLFVLALIGFRIYQLIAWGQSFEDNIQLAKEITEEIKQDKLSMSPTEYSSLHSLLDSTDSGIKGMAVDMLGNINGKHYRSDLNNTVDDLWASLRDKVLDSGLSKGDLTGDYAIRLTEYQKLVELLPTPEPEGWEPIQKKLDARAKFIEELKAIQPTEYHAHS